MKVIFLDFDGVLNSYFYFRQAFRTGASRWDESDEIDPKNVRHLNTLIEKSGAKVVVSSTWRLGEHLTLRPVAELQALLASRGFSGEVIGVTPCLDGPRGLEIQAWLDAHPEVFPYVILYDKDDMAHLRQSLVQTDARKGLKPRNVEAALRLLGVSA